MYPESKKNYNITVDDIYAPVLIIGTGIGGLVTAYCLSQSNIDYMIVTKEHSPKAGNTLLAPANSRVPEPQEIENIVKLSIEKCGAPRSLIYEIYKNSEWVKKFYNEIGLACNKTVFGVMPVDEKYKLGGRAIVEDLLPRINQPMNHMELLHIERSNDIIISYFYNSNYDKIYRIVSYNLVLATGGYGAIFSFNDNHVAATGEGILLAKSTGAKLKGMSTVMYHPWSVLNGKKILVGDIVALSGGKVIDDDGYQLIKDEKLVSAIKNNSYHEMFKDILEKEFEIIKSGKKMYLDMRCLDEEYVKNMLKLHGYVPEILVNGLIQIFPTVHYTSGGVVVDGNCQAVGVANLYVVGEAQFNGDKGCGRLPGQAFTSAIVCGKIISDAIKATKRISKPELIKEELCVPDLFAEFYSEESSDLSNIRDYQIQLGELLTFLTSEKISLLDLTSANEEIEKVESSVALMKGSGKDFLLILKVHFICGLAREILNDIKSREKTN